MPFRVGGVGELIDVEGVRSLACQTLGDVLVILGVAAPDVGARHHYFRSQRLKVEDLLLAHLVGDDEQEPVALAGGDECQRKPGVPGRRLDEETAGTDLALMLGRLDHGAGNAILDGSAWILALELDEEPARPGVEPGDLHQRRVAYQFDNVAHGCISFRGADLTIMSLA